MYVSNVSAQTMNLRYSYQTQQSSKTKEGQSDAASENQTSEKTEKQSSFSDILSVMSQESSPIENIDAYVQESVSKVLEKIAKHASEVFSRQSGSFSLSVTSISLTIEVEEGESLNDVKNELDGMLSEDGYWGVEKTSQRIFDFAVAFAGDDIEEIEKAKEAVSKGFEQAEAIMGGKLPQISHDTYDATMQKFDSYMEHISSSVSATYA